ncbi:TetR/AcrR family transcriptional regulator [Paractinoplanes maris]|uniref:TetR/AcrR family transcriptional regulator n=1 Tax=Paractinoplanes maris TaxID=1734446 RepID=UPI00201FDBE4|nr:TetR family transcriptional regulator [Actinoplanes maris]
MTLREALVAAARDLTVSAGWDNVRMIDVATAVGVSRQTVYNEFGGRSGLAEELATTEIQRFATAVRNELFAHGGDVRQAGRAAIAHVLNEAAENPLVSGILRSDRAGGAELLPYLSTRADVILAAAGQIIVEWASVHLPQLDAAVVNVGADSIVRLTVSHIVLPADSPEESADALAEVFVRLLR